MSDLEQRETEEIYTQFALLAHIMEDWAEQFDEDMSQFEEEENKYAEDKPVQLSPSVAAKLPSGPRKDTGSRSDKGWRRHLQEGTMILQTDPHNMAGEPMWSLHHNSYVPVNGMAYPVTPLARHAPKKKITKVVKPPNPPVKINPPVNETHVDLAPLIKPPPVPEPVIVPPEDDEEEKEIEIVYVPIDIAYGPTKRMSNAPRPVVQTYLQPRKPKQMMQVLQPQYQVFPHTWIEHTTQTLDRFNPFPEVKPKRHN